MEIGFSDRLGSIISLSNALVALGIPATEAQAEAKSLEDQFFQASSSLEDYQISIEGLLLTKVKPPSPDFEPDYSEDEREDEEVLNLEGPDIGNYGCATFHKDGQMCTIFKAKAKLESAPVTIVALKVTTPSAMEAPHNSIREARMLVQARHERVVDLLESFQQPDGRLVLVFPFLRQDLENLLRSGVLTKQQSKTISIALFEALAHVHSLGMIHRDVKPSNILLKGMTGPVYLADFGIAWSPTDPDSEPAAKKITDVGTTSYRPPEILFGCTNYDTALDMWAAGCVVAEMVKADHQPLFDASPLGSELGLIKSIFSKLGTPNEETWPSAKKYPDWGKMRFQQFPALPWKELLPRVSQSAMDFVKWTVRCESTQRMTAKEAVEYAKAVEW